MNLKQDKIKITTYLAFGIIAGLVAGYAYKN